MSSRATCPICKQCFLFKDMNNHIDTCLSTVALPPSPLAAADEDLQDQTQPTTNQKRKRNDGSVEMADLDRDEQPKKRSAWGCLLRGSSWKGTSKGKASAKVAGQDIGSPKDHQPKRLKAGMFSLQKSASLSPTKVRNFSSSSSTADCCTSTAFNHVASEPAASSTGLVQSNSPEPMSSTQPQKSTPKLDFRPLAERMRPKQIEDYIGQSQAVGKNSMLRRLLEADKVPSMILWGPPGCGKTTLATIISQRAKQNGKCRFVTMSATTSNVAQVKDAITAARNEQKMFKRNTILFIDEIHRFNKLQQDTFLPHVENGTITLIGATTENPSFKVNSALLSRCRVIVLDKLSSDDLGAILKRAATELGVEILEGDARSDENQGDVSIGNRLYIERDAMTTLANLCDGDARAALNALQMAVQSKSSTTDSSIPKRGSNKDAHLSNAADEDSDDAPMSELCVIRITDVKEGLQRSHIQYDRTGDEHYNCISALHKSMRGSDADAALYWMARMLLGGEDPLYVARRLIEFASVDVGLADPQALVQAVSTFQACQFLGMPVCETNLAQCVIYLSKAPKSKMVETVYNRVKTCIQEHQGPLPGVPLHLRNAPSVYLKKLEKGYDPSLKQQYLPDSLRGINFFQGTEYEFS